MRKSGKELASARKDKKMKQKVKISPLGNLLAQWKDGRNIFAWTEKDGRYWLGIFSDSMEYADFVYEWIPSAGFKKYEMPYDFNSCWEKCEGLCDRPKCHKVAPKKKQK